MWMMISLDDGGELEVYGVSTLVVPCSSRIIISTSDSFEFFIPPWTCWAILCHSFHQKCPKRCTNKYFSIKLSSTQSAAGELLTVIFMLNIDFRLAIFLCRRSRRWIKLHRNLVPHDLIKVFFCVQLRPAFRIPTTTTTTAQFAPFVRPISIVWSRLWGPFMLIESPFPGPSSLLF